MASHAAEQTAPAADTEQVQQALAGDACAFRAIMQTHNRRLYRIARSILRNNADAEDAVQDAYVSAFTNLASYRGEGTLKSWLSRIVINESLWDACGRGIHPSILPRWSSSKVRHRLFSFLSRYLTMIRNERRRRGK
jgi:RNA polymerase sigma factor (sigma-70 family)